MQQNNRYEFLFVVIIKNIQLINTCTITVVIKNKKTLKEKIFFFLFINKLINYDDDDYGDSEIISSQISVENLGRGKSPKTVSPWTLLARAFIDARML